MGEAASQDQDPQQMLSEGGIEALLARVKYQGGARFDAAGWHYLDTLARRAAQHEGSVRRMLDAKLQRSAAAFSERFDKARATAAELFDIGTTQHPEAAAELRRLFADGDFKGLRRLRSTLEAHQQCASLTGLVSQLETGIAGAAGPASTQSAALRPITAKAPTPELKTVRESRATWARLSVDRQLAQAMKQGPLNAGPINSHMLVLRSLSMMQDISPAYLNRIVSYVDTLLALDPGAKEVPVKRKKAPAAKVSRQTKATKK